VAGAIRGTLENFHEGWYYRDLWSNLAMMAAQYFAPMLVFLCAALVAVRWPRTGGLAHLLLAGLVAWFINTSAGRVLIAMPLVVLGGLYAFGRVRPARRATLLLVALPVLVIACCAIEPIWRIAHRVDDGFTGMRIIEGNGVRLRWAPAGPRWPEDGTSWDGARSACEHLNADGQSLAATPQNVWWCLPTVDEAVRSMVRHGVQAGGTWDQTHAEPTYAQTPDKETPLWAPHSKVIYWWTATEADATHAYRIVYNGQVHPMPKKVRWGYLAYRCVSDVSSR
jgi:hypothetical protein